VLIVVAILLLVFVLSPPLGIAVLVAAIVLEGAEIVFWRRFLSRYRVATGAEAMVGETAVVTEACDPEGTVKVRGEIWRARCAPGAEIGARVRVSAVDGLTLEVDPELPGNGKGPH
jgi:membrane protein implicated in regulation of membrane protease activity